MLAGEYKLALATFQENIDRGGPVATPVLCYSAAAHAGLGHPVEAAEYAARLRTEFPGFSIAGWNHLELIRDPVVRDRLVELMCAAGVP